MASRQAALLILQDAIELVRSGWTKYAVARNKFGYPVDARDRTACYYCLDGAIARAAWEREDRVNDILAIRAIENQEKCRIGTLNDELLRNTDDAVQVIERAVKHLSQSEKKRKRGRKKGDRPRRPRREGGQAEAVAP